MTCDRTSLERGTDAPKEAASRAGAIAGFAALRAGLGHPFIQRAAILLAMAGLLAWILVLFQNMPLVAGILLISWLYIDPSRSLTSASMMAVIVIYCISLFTIMTGGSFSLMELSSLLVALLAGMLARLLRR